MLRKALWKARSVVIAVSSGGRRLPYINRNGWPHTGTPPSGGPPEGIADMEFSEFYLDGSVLIHFLSWLYLT